MKWSYGRPPEHKLMKLGRSTVFLKTPFIFLSKHCKVVSWIKSQFSQWKFHWNLKKLIQRWFQRAAKDSRYLNGASVCQCLILTTLKSVVPGLRMMPALMQARFSNHHSGTFGRMTITLSPFLRPQPKVKALAKRILFSDKSWKDNFSSFPDWLSTHQNAGVSESWLFFISVGWGRSCS